MRQLLLLAFTVGFLQIPLPAQHQVLPDFQADPSARVFHGRLYVYPSHDIAGSKDWDMVDWHVFSTDDMVHWTDHGVIFSLKDIKWATKHAWAPDCIERNGKYYFYFPADDQIGVAVSDSPTGPFKDALGKPLIGAKEAGIRSIDPNIFIDDDGQAYLYFGNSHDKVGVVKLKPDMITRDGPIQVLDVKNYHEGIWVYKREGLYYFTYPSYRGDMVANLMEYSVANSPTGPFEYKGVILDNRSRNVHGSIVEFKGKWWLFYHVAGPSPYERRVCVAPLHYREDGSIEPIQMNGLPVSRFCLLACLRRGTEFQPRPSMTYAGFPQPDSLTRLLYLSQRTRKEPRTCGALLVGEEHLCFQDFGCKPNGIKILDLTLMESRF